MALIIVHHPVASVVHHSQCLLVRPRVCSDLVLQRIEHLLGFGKVEVFTLGDVCRIEVVLLDITTEDLHVVYDFW